MKMLMDRFGFQHKAKACGTIRPTYISRRSIITAQTTSIHCQMIRSTVH